uniref:Uncharacterized protein n=1 Tax=Panagrellus redivivus TaxID=6233 RepID=A0A7E4W6U3_PANRE
MGAIPKPILAVQPRIRPDRFSKCASRLASSTVYLIPKGGDPYERFPPGESRPDWVAPQFFCMFRRRSRFSKLLVALTRHDDLNTTKVISKPVRTSNFPLAKSNASHQFASDCNCWWCQHRDSAIQRIAFLQVALLSIYFDGTTIPLFAKSRFWRHPTGALSSGKTYPCQHRRLTVFAVPITSSIDVYYQLRHAHIWPRNESVQKIVILRVDT